MSWAELSVGKRGWTVCEVPGEWLHSSLLFCCWCCCCESILISTHLNVMSSLVEVYTGISGIKDWSQTLQRFRELGGNGFKTPNSNVHPHNTHTASIYIPGYTHFPSSHTDRASHEHIYSEEINIEVKALGCFSLKKPPKTLTQEGGERMIHSSAFSTSCLLELLMRNMCSRSKQPIKKPKAACSHSAIPRL